MSAMGFVLPLVVAEALPRRVESGSTPCCSEPPQVFLGGLHTELAELFRFERFAHLGFRVDVSGSDHDLTSPAHDVTRDALTVRGQQLPLLVRHRTNHGLAAEPG